MSEKDTSPEELLKKSSARLFVVGGVLLVVPLIVVIFESSICSNSSSTCLNSGATKIINTIFPYPMLAGGLLIGYAMKRFADSKQAESTNEDDEPDKI